MYARADFGDPVNGVILPPLSDVVTINSEDYVFVEVVPRKCNGEK